MSVVATSVFLLFALIVLGFILGKRNIIHKESIPDLSALVLQVTMPVTVFCSIIDQERSQLVSYGVQTFLFIILLHLCALLVGLILIHAVKVQDLDQGVWIYSMLFSNNGFMGIPLAPKMANFAAQPLSLGNTVNPDKIRKHPNADRIYPVSFFICICLSSVAYCAAFIKVSFISTFIFSLFLSPSMISRISTS